MPANDTVLTKIPNSMCDPYCTLSVPLWVGASSIEAYAVSDQSQCVAGPSSMDLVPVVRR